MQLHTTLSKIALTTLVTAAVLAIAACNGEEPAEPADRPEATPTPAEAPTPDEEADPAPEEPPPDEPDESGPEVGDPPDEPDLDAVEVTLTEVAQLRAPTAGAVGPDGHLFIAERGGHVRVLEDDGTVSEPVLDLSGQTTTDTERGLLGLAFSPDGQHVYASHTDANGDSRITEYTLDNGLPDPATERPVLQVDQPFGNHNGGDVHFGPDGMLFLGLGDGGGGGDPLEAGQDLGTLLGKLVRIDPRGGDPYGIPEDNPYVDTDGARDEIWSYGLRNPWRFFFDPITDDLWIADVGQRDREEINWQPFTDSAGANYGWNLMEGTMQFAGPEPDDHVPPIHEYDTTSARCAITGGQVYRGDTIPALRGAYLYSDFCEGVIRALAHRDGEVTATADLGVDGGQVVSFAHDAEGELYILDLGGTVWRLDPA